MTRDLNPATETASQADAIHPVLFVKLEFPDGDVLVHSEIGDLSFGGDTYTGVGLLGNVGTVEEDSELARTPLALTLSGIPTSMVSVVLNQQYQGRPATLSLGYLDLVTSQLVGDPVTLYRGRMDTVVVEQGESLSASLTVESRFAAWDRPNVRRYNDADQQGRYPGDLGLQFVEQSTDRQIVWGQKF